MLRPYKSSLINCQPPHLNNLGKFIWRMKKMWGDIYGSGCFEQN
jgi:hypothetical protein